MIDHIGVWADMCTCVCVCAGDNLLVHCEGVSLLKHLLIGLMKKLNGKSQERIVGPSRGKERGTGLG